MAGEFEREGRMHLHIRKSIALPALMLVGLGALVLTSGEQPAVAADSSAPAWTIQPDGKTLGFKVMNNGSEEVAGAFSEWNGMIRMDPVVPDGASIKIDVDLSSASVGEGFKDKLLGDEEFFNTPVYPTATFESNSVEALADGRFAAHGTLSIKGISQPQDIEFRLTPNGDGVHVEGSGVVAREPFNIGLGQYGGSLDRTVSVEFSFDATKE